MYRTVPPVLLHGHAGARRRRAGLLPSTPGPKGGHKLTGEVLGHLEGLLRADPSRSSAELAAEAEARFGVRVHLRSVRRALRRWAAEDRDAPKSDCLPGPVHGASGEGAAGAGTARVLWAVADVRLVLADVAIPLVLDRLRLASSHASRTQVPGVAHRRAVGSAEALAS